MFHDVVLAKERLDDLLGAGSKGYWSDFREYVCGHLSHRDWDARILRHFGGGTQRTQLAAAHNDFILAMFQSADMAVAAPKQQPSAARRCQQQQQQRPSKRKRNNNDARKATSTTSTTIAVGTKISSLIPPPPPPGLLKSSGASSGDATTTAAVATDTAATTTQQRATPRVIAATFDRDLPVPQPLTSAPQIERETAITYSINATAPPTSDSSHCIVRDATCERANLARLRPLIYLAASEAGVRDVGRGATDILANAANTLLLNIIEECVAAKCGAHKTTGGARHAFGPPRGPLTAEDFAFALSRYPTMLGSASATSRERIAAACEHPIT